MRQLLNSSPMEFTAERIAAFANIPLAFPDGLRYNETVIRGKRKGPDITEKENGRNLK